MYKPRHRSLFVRLALTCLPPLVMFGMWLAGMANLHAGFRNHTQSGVLELIPVLGFMIACYSLIVIINSVTIRGYCYSPLGPNIARTVPPSAWQGERVHSRLRIGVYNFNPIATCWVISEQGIAINVWIFISAFVAWDEIEAILPTDRPNLWAIVHRAPDIQSPLFCGRKIVALIKWPGIPSHVSHDLVK